MKPVPSAIHANTRIVLTTMAGCGSSRCCSSSPEATSAAYSRGLSRFNSAKGIWPVKMVVSMGNFSGRRWVLKKCTVKMKPVASRASSLWMVRRLADAWGMAVLVIEHDMNFVMSICDRITVIDFGKFVCEGTSAVVRKHPAAIAAYLGEDSHDAEEFEQKVAPR